MPHPHRDRIRLLLFDFKYGVRAWDEAADLILELFGEGVTPQTPDTGTQLLEPSPAGSGGGSK